MSDTFVQQQLCKKLDAFGTSKNAKNTIYRKLVNWDGDSRWTLIFDVFTTIQSAADFVNSQVPLEPLILDSLPARYMCSDKYKKQQEEQAIEDMARAHVNSTPAERKKKKSTQSESPSSEAPPTATATTAAPTSSKSSIAQEAILVAKNVDRVLSMKALHESLGNVKGAIAQFCNKKRYKNDEVAVALFLSLLNSANRIAQRIESYLNELKAM